ncbi:MAG: T9SS type B sorting domain-containing protein [Lutibacter sp.]|uniref:Ig-like domain-containing protein n=1 Tax=Lutibacter sp. TaxID=1925666 RepID=UPI0019FB5200|nr:T9SS type B sorting domain-containing protein [Lutibacter sp.]NOR28871.1 T9SS type B sorting domain-containing protein [Lutibacter sp.]
MSQKRFTTLFSLFFSIFLIQNNWAQIPPIVTATGNQLYCPLSQQNIVTNFDIIPGDAEINQLFIQISENYIQGEDTLTLLGSHPTISTSWDALEGKLNLSALTPSATAYLDLIAAVKDVVFESSTSLISGEKLFSITIDEANYLPSNGHFYEFVPDKGISWTAAKTAAESKFHYGLQGYLATVTSIEEAQITGEQSSNFGWIGGSDSEIENTWKWMTGPEAGLTFWFGTAGGTTIGADIPFAFWNSGEPNNLGNENYAHITAPGVGLPGSWNDLAESGDPDSDSDYHPQGYIVEYGGMPGDPILNISASTKISVPKISSITEESNCGIGTVSLSATATLGATILWFDSLTGGNIGSGPNFTTPSISSTTTFYVLASSTVLCEEGIRTPVIATIYNIPTITSVIETQICGSGTGTISATSSAGIVNWYDNLGNFIISGNNYSPTVTNTTTFYVDATENGCTTTSRTPVTLTVQHTASPSGVNIQTFCDIENKSIADLSVVGSAVLWYDTPSAGNLLNISEILTNTTYYASQTVNGCESPTRLAVSVTIFDTVVPLQPIDIPIMNVCDNLLDGDDTNGIVNVDLTSNASVLLNGKSASNFTLTYFTDAAYLSPINPTSFSNSVSGGQTIYVRITNNLDASCFTDISFQLKVNPLPVLLNTEVILEQCDDDLSNDGFSIFNLNEANELISTNHLNETFEFYTDNVHTQLINNPIAYKNPIVLNSEVFVKVITKNSCERFAKIVLKVGATQIPSDFLLEYYACEDNPSNNQDGKTLFDFSDAEQQLIDSKPIFSSQLVRISFYANLNDALSEINAIVNISNYENTTAWEQQIYVRIDSDDVNACLGLSHVITLHVEALPIANNVTIDRQCDDDFDGLFSFDTSTIENTVLNTQTNATVSYFDENGTTLSSPLPNPFLTKSQIITIRVTNNNTNVSTGACFDETTLEFIVDKKPIAYSIPNIIECDDDFDGLFSFDTSTIETTILNGQPGMLVSYFDENNTPLSSPLPNPFFTDTKTITVKVENELNTNCIAVTTVNFIVNPKPQFELDETAVYCLNLPPITVETYNASGNYTYQWENNSGLIISTNFYAEISSPGEYTVIATSLGGCKSLPKTILIEPSIIATITENDITIVDDSENNSITIATGNLGIGDYEFAIKKSDEFSSSFQDEPYFEQLTPGVYTVFIRDKNNCGIAQIDVSIIGFPKFFTPNNDGANDTWKVLGVNENFYATSNIFVFDRFGKLVTKIDPTSNGWDGFFNGVRLPSTDYWFSVELIDINGTIRTRKGHFSLIRR